MISLKKLCASAAAAAITVTSLMLPARAAEPVQSESEQAYEFLSALGMIDGSIAGIKPEDEMTRAQFAYVQAKLMGFEGSYPVTNSKKFLDVASGSEYEQAIYFLRDRGVISGYDEYRLMPEQTVTLEEACAMMVTALGYKWLVNKSYGGYSDGYVYVAVQEDILRGAFEKDKKLTFGEALILLKNAALTEVYIEKTDGNKVKYETDKGRTMLAEYCDIWGDEGIVKDNGITSLTGDAAVPNNYMAIGGDVLHYDGSAAMADRIGRYSEYYYHGEDLELLYIKDKYGKNNIVTVNAEDLDTGAQGYGTEAVYYYDGRKDNHANISVNADLIYNGSAYPDYNSETMKIKSGSITLIDNDTNGKYDVIVVEEYENMYLRGINADENKLTGADGSVIDLDDYDNITIYGADGKPGGINSVSKGYILSYMIAKNGRRIVIYASNKTANGIVSAYGSERDDVYYEIDGVRYKAAYSLIKDIEAGFAYAALPETGKTYTFRLDKDGRIAVAEEAYGSSWRYAYYIGMYIEEDDPDGRPVVRFVMADGSVYDAYTTEKISVDGNKINAKELYEDARLRSDGACIRQLLKIHLNGDGDLNSIEIAQEPTAYGYNSEKFSKDKTLASVKYTGDNTLIMGQYLVNGATVIFEDPNKGRTDVGLSTEDVLAMKISALRSGSRYANIDVYDADATLTAAALVYSGADTNYVYGAQLFTVDKVYKYVNEDNEVLNAVSGVSWGQNVTYYEDEEGIFPEDLKTGDVTRLWLSGNRIKSMDRLIELSLHPEPQVSVKIGSSIYEAEWANVFGYPYAKEGNGITLYMDDFVRYGRLIPFSLNNNVGKVTIYDAKRNTVYPGTIDDIASVGVIHSDGSFDIFEDTMLFIYRRYEYLREAVLVRY